jgi:hypothetical protein
MQNDSYNNRIEQDIARCNQDISKAVEQQNKSPQPQKSESFSHIMPIFDDILKNKSSQPHPPIQSADSKEFVRQMVEKISHSQQQDRSNEIPSLDLGSQILAQQRKVAGLKRKSPLQNNNSPIDQQQEDQPEQSQSLMPPAPASPQQKIIADIVAKEILVLAGAR